MEATTQTKQARHLTTGETFQRFGRSYVVVANERGSGGKGRSILATAQSGECVVLPMRATEDVPVEAPCTCADLDGFVSCPTHI